MRCAKCHQKEATIHFRTVVDGAEEETVHLCQDCAPHTGFDLDKLDLKEIEALSVIGKKCEFCGKDAVFWRDACERRATIIGASIVVRTYAHPLGFAPRRAP